MSDVKKQLAQDGGFLNNVSEIGRVSYTLRFETTIARGPFMKISVLVFWFLPLTLMSGCTTTSRLDSGLPFEFSKDQAVEGKNDKSSLANAEQSAVAFPELQGTWQSRCLYSDPAEPEDGYVKSVFSFNGNEFKSNTVIYSDWNCTEVLDRGFFHSGSSMQVEGVVSRPEGDVDTLVGSVPFIDIRFDQYMIDNQPMTGSMAAMFSPVVQYDIVHIEGETFYMGNNSGDRNSSSERLRPIELDSDKAFIKQ